MINLRVYGGTFDSIQKGKDSVLYFEGIDVPDVPQLAKIIELDYDTHKRTGQYKVVVMCKAEVVSGFAGSDDTVRMVVSM